MKQVLISGASGGIGESLCHYFQSLGYKVLAHARTEAKAKALVTNTQWLPVWGDVTEDSDIAAMAEQVREHGGLSLLVHNAGLLSNTKARGPHGVGMQAEVNVLAPYLLTAALADQLQANGQAKVVTVSSTAANFSRKPRYNDLAVPNGTALFGHYALSKSAANAVTLHMAKRWPNISFASTEPGFVNTKMTADNTSMPWVMGKLAGIIGSTPDQAAKRCFDALLTKDFPSGAIIQNGKAVDSSKNPWGSEMASSQLSALFQSAGIS